MASDSHSSLFHSPQLPPRSLPQIDPSRPASVHYFHPQPSEVHQAHPSQLPNAPPSPALNQALKHLSRAFRRSKQTLNRLIHRAKPVSASPVASTSVLAPPAPPSRPLSLTLSTTPVKTRTRARWSHRAPSTDVRSFGSLTPPASLSSPTARYSIASSSPAPSSTTRFRLPHPRTIIGSAWSDANSIQTTLTSLPGQSPSSAQCRLAPPGLPSLFSGFSPGPAGLLPPFGVPVAHALALSSASYAGVCGKGSVPTVVYECAERLKRSEGIRSRGIFRINGNVKRMRELEELFMDPRLGYGAHAHIWDRRATGEQSTSSGAGAIAGSVGSYFSVHDTAGVLRRYLWALPEPLVPYPVTATLVGIWRSEAGGLTEEELGQTLSEALRRQMGPETAELLGYLLEFLGMFAVRAEANLMTSKNLAIVYQPGIMPVLEDDRRSGLELDEYLRLIDEVQEVLRFLIDRFAGLCQAQSGLVDDGG